MTHELRPDGLPVQIDGVRLSTPGLAGRVRVHYPSGGTGLRSAEETSALLLEALDATDMQEQLTVEISDHHETSYEEDRDRGGGSDDAALTVTVPGPGSEMAQVMLVSDESGVLCWVYPDTNVADDAAIRGSADVTYTVTRTVVEADPGTTRGLIGAVGKKILKVLAFRLLDKAAGAAANRFAEQWERKAHPHRLRRFQPETYRSRDVAPITVDEIASLGSGPALLFVHGTMSLSHSGFGRLPQRTVETLNEVYGGRVFAFDHPTVSVTPTDNALWLAAALRGCELTVDIVAHSRGGLVSRVLTERPDVAELPLGTLMVRTLVMVGTPNAGTPLADRQYLGSFVNTVTNLLEFVPDNAFTDVLSVVLSVVKQLAVGAFGGLEGLMAMSPGGEYLTGFLNSPVRSGMPAGGTRYVAISSDYEPAADAPLARFARDWLFDRVFVSGNDLIVPNRSVFAENGSPRFPVAESLDLRAADAVDHSSYWTCPEVLQRFAEVLKG